MVVRELSPLVIGRKGPHNNMPVTANTRGSSAQVQSFHQPLCPIFTRYQDTDIPIWTDIDDDITSILSIPFHSACGTASVFLWNTIGCETSRRG